MPVVLDVDGANAWIEPGKREPEALLEILVPSPYRSRRRATSVAACGTSGTTILG